MNIILTVEEFNARIEALYAELARHRAKSEERRKVLEGVEWDYEKYATEKGDVGGLCRSCARWKLQGHAINCALAAALREE